MKWLVGSVALGSVVVSSAALAAHVGTLMVGSQEVSVGDDRTVLLYLDVEGVGEDGTSLEVFTENLATELDVDTGDTELGLYDANGRLIESDDDGGDGLASLLSFDGEDGDVLLPGRYTVVMGPFNTIFPANDPSSATSNGTGVTADVVVSVGSEPTCPHGPFLCDDAAVAFAAVNALDAGRIATGGASRFDPEVIEAQLAVARRKVSDAGCTVDAYTQRGYTVSIGGTYDATGIAGAASDGSTVTTGSISRPARTFQATFDDGTTLGDLSSTYDRNGRIGANLGTDGFFAGRFIRVRGTRGVWVGLGGPCDDSSLAPIQSYLSAFQPVVD